MEADADVTLIDVDLGVQVVRDPEYYKPSGDCKIRVEDTLFNIHRFLLERDSSAFETMFQLPQGMEKPQGSSDDDPIVLMGDTAEEFRALCWALYALPDEIVKESTATNSVKKLARVAVISHKYQLAAFQSWSLGSIRGRCTPGGYLRTCPSHLLPIILRPLILCREDSLVDTVVDVWLYRLSNLKQTGFIANFHAYDPLPVSAFSDAITFAEENQLRQFLGRLYYARLAVAHRDSKMPTSSLIKFPFGDLEHRHQQRILRGSWSLSAYWQHLITEKPSLQRNCPSSSTNCRPEWNSIWQDATAHGGATDILFKLRYIRDQIPSHRQNMTEGCANKGKAIIESLITQLEVALPDHFLGPP
ncbi:hypothetical protein DFH07DRAFT_968986 [Mycena maculata]|uniref:BTB domain-containing protein n=1 Tax=Mycena maculata TaxID=230809 RepID=A0AAD7MS75_9AGAR|nr:hypothetical protein DFH07DRAFT_968986 [Mycena maculata]